MQKQSRKIVLINQAYGGVEHLKFSLGSYLEKKGYNLQVVCGKNGDESLPSHEIRGKQEIIRVSNSVMQRNFWGRIKSYCSFILGFLKYIRRIENNSIVIVTSQPFMSVFIIACLKKKKKLTVLYNIQDLYPDIIVALNKKWMPKILLRTIKAWQKFALSRSDVIIAIGNSMKKLLEREYKESCGKIRVIENWGIREIENTVFKYKESPTGKLRVLYTGNMGESHEIETLLGAIRFIAHKREYRELVLFKIIGFGVNYLKLRSICEEEALDFVVFSDPIPTPELVREYKNSDISIVISDKRIEGILVPSKFYSLCMANPVIFIGSKTDTPAEHIKAGKLGFCFENGEAERLARALIKLAKDKEKKKQLRENARQYYREFLSSDIRLNQWEQIIKELH